jgi:hypothetical protein
MKKIVYLVSGFLFPNLVFAQQKPDSTGGKPHYPDVPYSVLTDKEWSRTFLLLVFIIVVIAFIHWARWNKNNPIGEKTYGNMMTLALTIGAMAVFVTAGYDSTQLQAPFGIIGTLVAYLLGQKASSKKSE